MRVCTPMCACVCRPLCLHPEAGVRQAACLQPEVWGPGSRTGVLRQCTQPPPGPVSLALEEPAALPGSRACSPVAGALAFLLCVKRKGVCFGRPASN